MFFMTPKEHVVPVGRPVVAATKIEKSQKFDLLQFSFRLTG